MINIKKGKYAVLGGSGLVGHSVLSFLKDIDGVDVISTYFRSGPSVYAGNISYRKVDLREKEECYELLQGIDYVIMLASNILLKTSKEECFVRCINDNLKMVCNALEGSYFNHVKKFVFISSTTGYPYKDEIISEGDMFVGDPLDQYLYVGWTNRYLEKLCFMYSEKNVNRFPIIIFRPTCIYGEKEGFDLFKCHFLPSMVRMIVDEKKEIEVWGDGKIKRNFIHADDVARAILMSVDKINCFDTFNIGGEKMYEVNDIIKMICDASQYENPNIVYLNNNVNIEKNRFFSFNRAYSVLGFYPEITLASGIDRLVKEYKNISRLQNEKN